MLFVPLHLLRPGMILASGIPSHNLCLPLVTAGQVLTDRIIQSLAEHGIQGAYIESAIADDIEPKAFFRPEQRTALLEGIKSEFEKARASGSLPSSKLFEGMAEQVVMAALKQEDLLYNVITIRNYDDYTYSHSLYVGGIAALIGAHMKLQHRQLITLSTAGLLHDIGKLDISHAIVNKPSALTDEEFVLMQEHPVLGVTRLQNSRALHYNVLRGVESHHEFFDGTGYPFKLSGGDIPLFGRVLAIADVYDALSSARSYRSAWNPSQIIDYISSRSGMQFDPDLIPAFLHSVAPYPVGSLVKLSNGWMGVVVKNHPNLTLRPSVRIISPSAEAGRNIDLTCEMFHVTVLDLVSEGDHLIIP